ncbi:MAG: T9SS type A sorting domain-containing protein [Bacteroidota bacterium]
MKTHNLSYLTLAFLLCSFISVHAQKYFTGNHYALNQSFFGSSKESISGSAITFADADDFVYVGVKTSSHLDANSIMLGFYGMYVAKVDQDGKILWEKGFVDNSGYQYTFWPEVIRKTPDGGFIIGASATSTISSTYESACLFKIDANGKEEWRTNAFTLSYGNPNPYQAEETQLGDVQITAQGEYVVTASITRVINSYTTDALIAIWTFDKKGTLQKEGYFNLSGISFPKRVIQLADGGFGILADYYNSNFTQKTVFIKVDQNLKYQWNHIYEYKANEDLIAVDMMLSRDDNIVIAGELNHNGNTYACLIKTDQNGKKLWNTSKKIQNHYGKSFTIHPKAIDEDDNGNIYVGGDNFELITQSNGNINIGNNNFVIKVTEQGRTDWGMTYNDSTLMSYAYDLAVTDRGDFMMIGCQDNGYNGETLVIKADEDGYTNCKDDQETIVTYGYNIQAQSLNIQSKQAILLNFPMDTLQTTFGLYAVDCHTPSIWYFPLVKDHQNDLTHKTTVSNTVLQPQLSIYPNPTSDFVNIQLPSSTKEGRLALFDLNGRLISRQLFNNKSMQLHLDGLVKGTYLIQLEIDGQLYQERLVKQ